MNSKKISFAFVDEVGTGKDPSQPLFGVGVIVIEDTIKLNKKLHQILEEALSRFNVKNILQLESQGSLLLQVTDIILGGINFKERMKYNQSNKRLNPFRKIIAEEIIKIKGKKIRGYEPGSILLT